MGQEFINLFCNPKLTFKKYLMMKNYFKKNNLLEKMLTMIVLFSATIPFFAQGGATALTDAATEIQTYWDPIKLIIQAIGGVVGLIGGIRIYNKWQNGDQDINKELVGWGGSALFLIIVPQFVSSFFS